MPAKPPSLRYARDANMRQTFRISRKTLEAVERIMEDNRNSVRKAHEGMDLLVRLLILVTKAEAQRRSMGPVAPRHRSRPELAGRIPVQRITGRYFAGWQVRRLRSGHYRLSNDSVEAYLIETGLFQRTRRPILKLSVIGMLRFVQTTSTANRFMSWVLAPRRDERGRFQSFNSRLAGTATLSSGLEGMAGPQGKLPG